MKSIRSFEIEARILGNDGQYRWFLLRFNPLRDEEGGIVRWYVSVRLAKAARQSAVLEERNRLAGEIHDSLAQSFAGISMQLDLAQEEMAAKEGVPLGYIRHDLAIPRDIDLAVRKLAGVYLYDLDSLQSMSKRTLATRKQESEKCRELIEHHVQDFQLWIEHIQSSSLHFDGRRIAGAWTRFRGVV